MFKNVSCKYFHLPIIAAFTVPVLFTFKTKQHQTVFETELLQNCEDVIFFSHSILDIILLSYTLFYIVYSI